MADGKSYEEIWQLLVGGYMNRMTAHERQGLEGTSELAVCRDVGGVGLVVADIRDGRLVFRIVAEDGVWDIPIDGASIRRL